METAACFGGRCCNGEYGCVGVQEALQPRTSALADGHLQTQGTFSKLVGILLYVPNTVPQTANTYNRF